MEELIGHLGRPAVDIISFRGPLSFYVSLSLESKGGQTTPTPCRIHHRPLVQCHGPIWSSRRMKTMRGWPVLV